MTKILLASAAIALAFPQVGRGHIENNVWRGQSVPKRKGPKQEAKRPYTDEEVNESRRVQN